jgi:Tfp pilus assembly protein PilO
MPESKQERIWLIAGAGLAMLVVLLGYFALIGPAQSRESSVHSQIDQVNAHNAALQAEIASYREQSKNLPMYAARLRTAQLALPSTSGLPDFLRTLSSLGSQTMTDVTSLTVGSPADVSEVTGNKAASTNGAPIYALPITAQVTGTVAQLNQFLGQLQSVQPRAVLITQIQQQSAIPDASVTLTGPTQLTITMAAFVQPTGSEAAALKNAAR